MFEAHVLHLLRRYLGEYVHGLSAEALRISVWKGDVVLKDLRLKAEALNSLRLPVTVKAGFVGTITLKVPWKSLGKEPVIVLIDRVFVLAHPAPDGRTLKEEDREKLFEAKLQQIEEVESATLEGISKSKQGSTPPGNSWLGSLIATIIGNLKITISNVHIRYEDTVSNLEHPFSSGITLAKLAAVTMDEQGNETFDTSGALDKLRKSLQLERLAVYHDSDSLPWKIEKGWEHLSPKEWVEIFEDGINEPVAESGTVSKWAVHRKYVVSPINGNLKYHRLGKQEKNDPEVPFEKASLVLSDVSLTVTEVQYHDWIKLLEAVSRYRTHVDVSHLRPMVPISQDPYLWWHYAAQAALQQRKMCYRFSWDRIRHLCQLRRRYIQLYAGSLQHLANVNNAEIREIERDLDSKVILLWRLLAHAKVESAKSKEAAEQRRLKKKSWLSFRWYTPSEEAPVGDTSEGPQLLEERLTKEEWKAINKLLSYQPEDELTSLSGKEVQNMIQFLVTVSVGRAAARIMSINQTEIICGRFEDLEVSTKFKHRSTQCDVLLRFYGLSGPEGSLAESVCSEQKLNALAANFVHSPVGENVDWRLSATISPCHVTVLMESYDRFLEFVRRSKAVSPTVALETATALQMKIESVTRRAQEQFQMVLEEQSRFALDIDFDAPKVRVPIRILGSSKCDCHFLLDFGHFTVHTTESQSDEQRQNMYSRFFISGRDIAAFFTDCGSDCQSCTLAVPKYDSNPIIPPPEKVDNFYSLIDRCGMAVLVDQIKVPHPSYPSTRISVQVPNLGVHFSPSRYRRLMQLLDILYGTMDTCNQPAGKDFQAELTSWSSADLASDAKILVWKGIGNSVATWQPCFLVLSGLYLYVLESEKSPTYQRYSSMAGRQVFDVPPTNIGGLPFCIAISYRGFEIQKALESSSTWIIAFRDEEEKATWLKGLILATYQASAPPSVDVLGESSGRVSDFGEPQTTSLKTAELVINGALVETKLFIYGNTGDEADDKLDETLILDVLAGGGKVHMIRCEGDLTIRMKLHSLQIRDELRGRLSASPQYLACSVLRNDRTYSSPDITDPHEEMPVAANEDDDAFKDALPEFATLSDATCNSQNLDPAPCGTTGLNIGPVGFESAKALIQEQDLVIGRGVSGEIFYEAEGGDYMDFVSVIFSSRTPSSHDYDGIDTQMSVRMSKLEFFCNRPTLVALIGFGLDLSSVNFGARSSDTETVSEDKSVMNKEKNEETERVKGLLGYGKNRVVFYLNMNVDSVSMYLNKEDGSPLAILVQESFLLDLKVHPSSLSIEGTLGNFRLCDVSLGTEHCWGWLCDIRNPGVESLIKFKFNSYSAEDDDYEGYDYSLQGRLSAVRIVFLYRFVQEITVYFMELATPRTEEAIKLVDKVGGFEWFIQKYEIDGATALKLDLSLDTPIIIVPRNSTSKDFIQLDLGQLQVSNSFRWYGSAENDPSAVHIDVLHAEILGINMFVGIDGCIGKPMIREAKGLDIYVRRSLRDVFKKVPTFSLEVKVSLFHCVLTGKEYKVILDCAYMNLCEEPRLPPSFRGGKSGSKDTMRLLVDKVNMNSQNLLSRTVTISTVVVDHALLELYNGIHDESRLAHIALEGLWVSYRMTSLSETDLYVTIPKFSVLDIRPDTKPEMRLMLGSSTDVSKQVSAGNMPFSPNKGSFRKTESEAGLHVDLPTSTMFLMDYRWRKLSQSFVVRVQQPRVLVVPDFLLAVTEFFVPALGTITGREETMDPKNDPLCRNSSIVLSEPSYKQREDVVHLSPSRQLVANFSNIDEYTYDGCGKIICLSEEPDFKESYWARSHPIIIIGRGKKLRFVNVKIENGSLLRKYTYLGNDSSYSVSFEDGVDIMLLDSSSSDSNKKQMEYMHELSDTTNFSPLSQCNSNRIPSFTFETLVVSPEFTFYDGTKSSLNDSSYGEKLLRAKLDLSFMYASKENDTWIRALVKDLTIEAGSGLIILDPVDISGGYTSVKEKTNMSLISTNICIHLSLSAISLMLNLQNQASAALQFGNMIPLAPCTNFDRIWVSPKENGPGYNLTFWRPRAPSNYVILGDCVTSRPIPPSQAVMAVSNTYGRVRKPIGFNLIGFFSGILGLSGGEGQADVNSDCSLWEPVAPPGYTALGCVVNIGNQEPPNHIVYCIRSDLVTMTNYSECIFSVPSNPCFLSGFSIWRLDNILGSFSAHSSIQCPSVDNSWDLNHLLIWSSNRHYSPKESASGFTINHDYGGQETSNQNSNSSGWDVVRSISKATNFYMSTPNFERIWWDKGGDVRRPVSIWRPIARPGYAILGDCIIEGLEPPALGIIFRADNPDISAKPVQLTKVAHIVGKGFDEVFFWYPIAPPGYASLGCLVSKTDEAPSINTLCCPRMDLVNQANILEGPISRSSSSKASQSWSIWKVENQACTFLARGDLKKPSSRLAYTIGDSVKPKTRENITAEMKLSCFSLTVLDSLCGMMTPLFDATITNIKLATHGQLDAMNAVLISAIAASTFNTQLEAWEPLVEPFDGIFKFETYDTNVNPPSKLGKRVRIAATTVVNVNVSAASLENVVGSILSWRRQLELEKKATRLNEEIGSLHGDREDPSFSALDEDDFQTLIVENKLGCDIYLKRIEQNSDTLDQLRHGDCASVWIPPPRFSDRLNFADESREARYYVAIWILEAKGLPVIDDGNGQAFFCALRLVVDSQVTDQQKLFPQSARTKCVKPSISRNNDLDEGTAKWNELFIFEIPQKAAAKLEVEVTNLAAKAGKGEVVGALSFSVGQGANTLRKVASVRMFHQAHEAPNIISYPLKRNFQQNSLDEVLDFGCLLVSTTCFERKTTTKFQKDMGRENVMERDTGFWVGLSPQGTWESIRSLLPLSVVPKLLQNDFIAMEVVMKNGRKHAVFRSLATLVNESNVNLDISISHLSPNSGTSNSSVVEEIFQNQRCQPSSGWGNNWSGFGSVEPGPWSTRDFSDSSKDFSEPPLPTGWRWSSTWTIDKSQFVDKDGWAYGPDFRSLRWPPTSSKSCTKSSSDLVRRRRWIRTRQQIPNSDFPVINPGASVVLPWRSTSRDSNQCLQIRPSVDHPQPPYAWGYAVTVGSGYAYGKDQALVEQVSLSRQYASKQENEMSNFTFKLDKLEKKDILLCCSSTGKNQFWLSIGTDASVLHTELNAPVYDWRISVNAPLKLENRFPCPAEFIIWEKTKEGNCVERQHGIISSRGSVHIYSADIQKPIYLTLLVQGGWVMEKEPVLVLNTSSNDHASSFWMVQQQSKRRLRVRIEHDMGGTTAAPKTIRFFVPYWIVNNSSLSLVYRVVEVEPLDSAEMDSQILSRAVKSAKKALKSPTTSMERKHSTPRRNIQVLEVIEETSPLPCMLSPQDNAGRSGVMLFQSQKDSYVSPRVGIAVATRHSEIFSPGISLLELEKKERVDVKAFCSDGSYYKLSARLNLTSDRTKVLHFQPYFLFINRVGYSLCLQQCESQLVTWIHPTDSPKPFRWQSSKVEILKLRVDGYKWSTPFSVSNEGVTRICLKKDTGNDQLQLRVAIRSGAKSSSYEVIFRPDSSSSPYRIENRSLFLPIHFRQVDGTNDSWQFLLPNSAASFLWEDLGRRRLLEVLIDGADQSRSQKFDIDEISDHKPINMTSGPSRAIRITIVKEEKINVVKISDWMPESEATGILNKTDASPLSQLSLKDLPQQQSKSSSDSEFHLIVELAELGVSIVDHAPEEILYLSVLNLLLAYSTGLGSGFSRFKLRMHGIQVDNQLPLTPMPVLFRPQKVGEETDYVLKFSVTMQSNGSLDLCVYPYIGFYGPESAAFLINIHEPIIWRLHEMIQQVNFNRLFDNQTTAVAVDPIIQIGVLNISEVRFKVSMAMSPSQRPRGVLGFWASLMTALGNTENMPVRINQRFHENVCMRQSLMTSIAISNIRKDLLGQPLQLLSGVDILGNASSALGHMSKGMAALSMDKKFIQRRQRQESKGIEDLGDVIREGGGALAKGLFRGVTGILTKPLEGAKTSGVEGFVQGVGRGIIGAAAQPVSGVLDLLSKTTEGANAMRMKIASAITSDEQLLRRRLPRVISGDNLLRPYDEYKAQGQIILQLAESGSFLGQVDLFKVRGKFALTDSYEDHFLLPKGKILVVTHRRVILLQQPSNIIAQRKFSPAKDPCSIVWDVLWDDLATMELTHGKKDNPKALSSRLILYLRSRSTELKEQVRVVKCIPETHQALEIYSSIELALQNYGPNQSKDSRKKKVTRPYSPIAEGASTEVVTKEAFSILFPQQLWKITTAQSRSLLLMAKREPLKWRMAGPPERAF
ncbi:Phosphatidylinositol-4, 5-bisphosphate phosphodiesterase gamma [Parasponia andersonii]|uniref:Phosphatidylinositol-4, 5-bisphosphate phosphodiesterase gamma n=1 Tax=Parasponia andersonii TaxID=3476 RepID=A0A2P5CUX9_PARAD|nr:Phosphatidylinositol-4, 5-bisphosphate phosphodiesterase gamma [Parasponia andersonii]